MFVCASLVQERTGPHYYLRVNSVVLRFVESFKQAFERSIWHANQLGFAFFSLLFYSILQAQTVNRRGLFKD